MYCREYIIKALDVYKWNNRVSRSEIVNKLLEDFLIRTGYMNDKGEVIRERVLGECGTQCAACAKRERGTGRCRQIEPPFLRALSYPIQCRSSIASQATL